MSGEAFLDGDEIDLYLIFGDFLFHTVPADGEEEATTFFSGEGLDGTAVRGAGAVLDLKKDGTTVFCSDDIDLTSLGRDVVRLDDLIVVALEILDGDEFALISDSAMRFGHITRCLFSRYL